MADVLLLGFLGGIKFPLISAIILYIIILARALYAIFYLSPKGSANPIRGISSLVGFIAKFALIGVTIYGSILILLK